MLTNYISLLEAYCIKPKLKLDRYELTPKIYCVHVLRSEASQIFKMVLAHFSPKN